MYVLPSLQPPFPATHPRLRLWAQAFGGIKLYQFVRGTTAGKWELLSSSARPRCAYERVVLPCLARSAALGSGPGLA